MSMGTPCTLRRGLRAPALVRPVGCRTPVLTVRCQRRVGGAVNSEAPHETASDKTAERTSVGTSFASFMLAGATAASLLLSALPATAAVSITDMEAAKSQEYEKQLAVMQYTFEQQQIARKAALASQRQALTMEATQIENTLDQKLIEEQAIALAAEEKGDIKAAVAARTAEAATISQKEALEEAVARAEATLAREEILEKAVIASREQELKQITASVPEPEAMPVASPSVEVVPPIPVSAPTPTPAPTTSDVKIEDSTSQTPSVDLIAEALVPESVAVEAPSTPPSKDTGKAADNLTQALDAWLAQFEK